MRLIAERPWSDLPARAGPLRLAAAEFERMTLIQPLPGQDVSEALRAAVGLGFPAPGRSAATATARIVWAGWEEAWLLGPPVVVGGAACTDQSDGWAALRLGGDVRGVLARLCPLDLRAQSFAAGDTARSLLDRIPCSLTRIDDDAWLLLVPRSVAGSALAHLLKAAERLAARG